MFTIFLVVFFKILTVCTWKNFNLILSDMVYPSFGLLHYLWFLKLHINILKFKLIMAVLGGWWLSSVSYHPQFTYLRCAFCPVVNVELSGQSFNTHTHTRALSVFLDNNLEVNLNEINGPSGCWPCRLCYFFLYFCLTILMCADIYLIKIKVSQGW